MHFTSESQQHDATGKCRYLPCDPPHACRDCYRYYYIVTMLLHTSVLPFSCWKTRAKHRVATKSRTINCRSHHHGRVPLQLIPLCKCGTRTWRRWGCSKNRQVPAAVMKDAVKTWRKIPDWSARWSASSCASSSPLSLSDSPPSCHSHTVAVTTHKEQTRGGGVRTEGEGLMGGRGQREYQLALPMTSLALSLSSVYSLSWQTGQCARGEQGAPAIELFIILRPQDKTVRGWTAHPNFFKIISTL